MKKIFLLAILATSIRGFAQKIDATKVPGTIVAAFNKSFPNVTDVQWEKEHENYEANFKQTDKKMSAIYDANGKWLQTETDIPVKSLPAAAYSYITANYKDKKIKEAALLQMANGDNNYEAEVDGKDVIFDNKGTFIKAVKD